LETKSGRLKVLVLKSRAPWAAAAANAEQGSSNRAVEKPFESEPVLSDTEKLKIEEAKLQAQLKARHLTKMKKDGYDKVADSIFNFCDIFRPRGSSGHGRGSVARARS
jgi:hypothetical protein